MDYLYQLASGERNDTGGFRAVIKLKCSTADNVTIGWQNFPLSVAVLGAPGAPILVDVVGLHTGRTLFANTVPSIKGMLHCRR